MEYRILKKEQMYCSICDKEHELELRESDSILEIKGEEIKYKEIYYCCTNTEKNNCFTINNMMSENILRAKDNYRKKHNLLTSKEIKEIRNFFELTQAEFSIILGLGEITITRYETKQIQDTSIDKLIKFVRDNPIVLLDYLEDKKDKFSKERYSQIKESIKNKIKNNSYSDNFKIQLLKYKYIEFDKKSDENGNCILDIDKLNNIIAYIVYKMNSLSITLKKVVLMKLLWYIDAKSFKEYNKAITGLVYVHEQFGALPIGHDEILSLPSIKVEKITLEEDHYQYNIDLNKNYKIKYIDNKENEIIDKVINKFKNYRSSEISEYMHKEDAYKETLLCQIIPFSLTKTLNEF